MRESKNLLALIAFGGSGTKGEQKSKPVGRLCFEPVGQRSSNFKIKKLITNLNYNIFLELFLNEMVYV